MKLLKLLADFFSSTLKCPICNVKLDDNHHCNKCDGTWEVDKEAGPMGSLDTILTGKRLN